MPELIEREYHGFMIRPSLSGLYSVSQKGAGDVPASLKGHFTGVDWAMRAIDTHRNGVQEKLETSRVRTPKKQSQSED